MMDAARGDERVCGDVRTRNVLSAVTGNKKVEMTAEAPPTKPSQSEPLIRMRNVKKIFRRGAHDHLAVSDVTMDIHDGDFVSLVGPSGCGKTTILKILAGLYPIDEGSVLFRGDFDSETDQHQVGMVFQQPLLLKWRTVLENVMLPAEILRLPTGPSRQRAIARLEMVGLGGYENK
jgi:NitT/TauT family transport system ATP-binding protein